MPNWNPLNHPSICEVPKFGLGSPWEENIPLVQLAVELTRPAVLVEVGTYDCVSYFTLCDAVSRLGLPTRCTAIGRWGTSRDGDHWGAETLVGARLRHDARYASFSRLVRSTRPSAETDEFPDSSIDLLHLSRSEAAEGAAWLPKLSRSGVILVSGLAASGELWSSLTRDFPNLEFANDFGMVAVGKSVPADFLNFLAIGADPHWESYRRFFRALGRRAVEAAERRIQLERSHYHLQTMESELHMAGQAHWDREKTELTAHFLREREQWAEGTAREKATWRDQSSEIAARHQIELRQLWAEFQEEKKTLWQRQGELISALERTQTSLDRARSDLHHLNDQIYRVRRSASWRLGRAVVVPLAFVYYWVSRTLGLRRGRDGV